MAIYDINSALRPYSFAQSAVAGLQTAYGIQQLQELASKRRSTMALARAMRGDAGAMADIDDPEMLTQAQQFQRQQGLRGFFNPVDQNVVGINSLETLANAKPRGFDVQGAADYMVSQGAGADEISPLLKLAELRAPQSDEYMGSTVTDLEGNVLGVSKRRGWHPIGVTAQSAKPTVSSDRLITYGPGGQVAGVESLPMTPQEQARTRADQERLAMERERLRMGRVPRTQVIQDESGTYVVDLDNPTAPVVPVTKPGGAAIVKPPAGGGVPTEDERKAAGWLAQAENAWKNMSNIIQKNPSAIEQGLIERVLPEGVANVARSEDRQMFLQGARSLSEAALRAATGAGVNYEEARQKVEELTPIYGDKPAVIKQKLDSIKVYLDSLKSRAGRALPKQRQPSQRPIAPAANWLKSRNLQTQQQFNAAVQELRRRGWNEQEIRQATQEAGL